ncbi:Facilitated trehalose transporter Tret1 [Pseudolycoriella hygida]|uniref:Facilitated trehalose transporter Tret1 n=1 Tax=Pseudolycoriella hygida TaxID=35572 RepID=A0A9Q0MLP4_9DIPT|nr:Facilitated trehalose transporter Tret1 [Pseudolycoriella hygida]
MEKVKVKEEELSDSETPIVKDKYWFQFVVAFSGTFCLLSAAVAFGWNSPAIPKLRLDDSPIPPITGDQSSWIVALMKVGSISASFCAIWLMNKVGRKTLLLMASVPLIISWILIGVAESIALIYVSRILSGLAYGTSYSVLPMYLGEIASNRIRGAISTLLTVMAKFGILYAYSIGPYVSVRLMAWLSIIPAGIFVATFIWLPESPYYLLVKNEREQARRSLTRLRQHENVDEELERMSVAVKKSQENKGTFQELFFDETNRMSLIIIIGLATAQQLCGSQAIIAYSETIFKRVGSTLGASESTIILGVVQLVSAAVSSSIVDIVGRRPLLLSSVIGAAVCNTVVGLYFFLERMEIDVTGIAWLPMLAIMVFIVMYTIGMATVTFAILGEIIKINLKSVAGPTFTITGGAISFIVVKLFQVVSDDLGSDYTFWGFALLTYLFIPFVWFLIPETKGKSFEVILDELNARYRKKKPMSSK